MRCRCVCVDIARWVHGCMIEVGQCGYMLHGYLQAGVCMQQDSGSAGGGLCGGHGLRPLPEAEQMQVTAIWTQWLTHIITVQYILKSSCNKHVFHSSFLSALTLLRCICDAHACHALSRLRWKACVSSRTMLGISWEKCMARWRYAGYLGSCVGFDTTSHCPGMAMCIKMSVQVHLHRVIKSFLGISSPPC